MYRVFLLLLVASKAQDDDFMWFRCDACSASFFKINRTLIEKQLLRRASVASYEFLEIIDEVCDTMFTKQEYGVKQHEGKKYLFGPGVSDHIPGQGFGQMGMGDYDKRLASYCKMFVEEFGEEELQKRFWEDRQVNHTEICQAECQSSASGTGAQSKTPRKPKVPRSPRSSAEEKVPKESAKAKPMPKTKPANLPKATTGEPVSETAEAEVLKVTEVLRTLPKMKTKELQKLGEAILGELSSRAAPPVRTEL